MKIIFLLLLISSTAFAQSSAHFAITRGVTAGGGVTASGPSRFQLTSTIGQPLAATPSGSRFSIQGGFWIHPAPIFFAPTKAGTNFLVSIQSESGKTYTVQSLNMLNSSWQNLLTVPGNGGIIRVTNAVAGVSPQFYRLLEQ
jgi:hypothetical protein